MVFLKTKYEDYFNKLAIKIKLKTI